MGFSKWRKILTILMIISLCFTLFSKISKVFAAENTSNATSIYIYGKYYDFYINDLIEDYDYYFLFTYNDYFANSVDSNGKGYQNLMLYCSNEKINFNTEINNNGVISNYVFSESENNTHSMFSILTYTTQRYNYDNIATSFDLVGFDNSLNVGEYTTITGSNSYPTSYPYAYQGINVHFPNFFIDHYYQKYFAISNGNDDPEYSFLYSNYDIIDTRTNDLFFRNSTLKPPELATSITDLENLDFDGLSINSWDYSDINFYLLIYDRTLIGNDYDYVINPAREILINKNSSYYQPTLTADPTTNCVYFIPISDIGLQFQKNGIYEIRFGIKEYYNERRRSAEEVEDGRGVTSEDPTPTEFVDPEDIYSDTDSSGTGTGGGFSSRPYYYTHIGTNYVWEISSEVSQAKIDSINNSITLTNEQRRHYEITSLLEDILDGTISFQDELFIRSGIIRENNQDITTDGFGHIFTRFYNAISSTATPVEVNLPYTSTPITINGNVIYNGLGQNNSAILLIHSCYFFVISLYIVKDIQQTIEQVKNGDITTSSDTNIKADML